MKKWILLAVGLLLLLPEAWYLISGPARPDDARVAFENLVEIPVSQLQEQYSVNVSVPAPNNPAWKRIMRGWGEPSYTIALLSSTGNYQYCFDKVNVKVSQEDRQLNLEHANWIYGVSSSDYDKFPQECKSEGETFRVRPGSIVQIQLAAKGDQLPHGANIIVRPVWYYTKDKLVGLDLDEDLHRIARWVAVSGLGMMLLAGLLFVKHEHRSFAPQKNKSS